MTVFPTLFYTSTHEILTLLYTSRLKRYPFRAEPPRIVHYREYPPGGGKYGGHQRANEKEEADVAGLCSQNGQSYERTHCTFINGCLKAEGEV